MAEVNRTDKSALKVVVRHFNAKLLQLRDYLFAGFTVKKILTLKNPAKKKRETFDLSN